MSENIENRIVRMEFDNERFEKNTKKTMSTLDKLKAKLDFSGVNKSIDETSESLENMNTKKAEKSVGLLTKGYTALKIAAVSAIATMTATFTQAIMQNKQLLSKITQMRNGWNDYAIKTQSVQTILTALNDTYGTQAEKMELVTEKIEQLKWFADETSYSLKGMTGALSKFLSAGVGLDESVNAVQGISVWAAMEGQGKQAAEHISTQMAQALGRNLMAQDWSSVETMNMGSETFKTALLRMAALDKESGVLEKDGKFYFGGLAESVSMYGLRLTEAGKAMEDLNAENEITMANFRTYLSKGIISGSTLSKVFDEYGKFATELNTVNGAIEEFGGEAPILMKWRKFFDIFDATDNATDFFEQVYQNEDLAEIFEATTYSAEKFYEVMTKLGGEEFAFSREGTFLAYEAKTFQEAIEATATGMATQFSDIFESIFGNYLQARDVFSKFSEWLYDIFITPLGNLAEDFRTALAVPEGELNPILKAFGNLGNAIMDVINAWRGAKSEVFGDRSGTIKKFADLMESITGKLAAFTKKNGPKLQSIFKGILTVCKGLLTVLKAVAGFIWDIITGIIDLFGSLFESISEVFTDKKSEDGLEEEASLAERFASALEIVKNALKTVGGWFKNVIQYIKDSEILNTIVTALAEVFVWLVEKANALVQWGKDIGLWEKLATVLKWVGEGIASIISGLANLITGKGGGLGSIFGKATEKAETFRESLSGVQKEEEKVASIEEEKTAPAFKSVAEAMEYAREQTKFMSEPYGSIGTMLAATNDISMYAGASASTTVSEDADKASDAVEKVSENVESATDSALSFGNVMVVLAIAFARVTDMFLNPKFIMSLAISIFALAVAIGALKKSLMSGNFFSLFSFGSISRSVDRVSASSVLVGLAAVIAVVAGAVWLLSTVPTEKLKAMTGVLIGIGAFIILILGELIAIESVIKGKTTSNVFAKAGGGKADLKYSKHGVDASDFLFGTLLSIAAIIAACALIIWALSGADLTNNYGRFAGILTGIGIFVVTILLEVIWLEKVMKEDSTEIEANPKTNLADILSSSLLGVAVLMFGVAKVIKVLSGMDPEKMWAMLPILGLIFTFVSALVVGLMFFCMKMSSQEKKLSNTKKTTSLFKTGEVIGLLFAAVGAIGLIMTAVGALVLIIATNPHLLAAPDAFLKIMATIALFIGLLAVVMLGIVESFKRMPANGNNFDPAKMYKLVLSYCIGLSLIITAVAGLATVVGAFGLNPNFLENMATTMAMLALLMGIFAVAVTKLRKSKASSTNELIKMMLSFAGALAIVITSFAIALAVMPAGDGLITKAIVLGSLITILGAGLWAITRFGKLDNKKVIIFSACLVALSTGMLAMAGAIKMLDGISTNSIVAIGITLGLLMALMGGIVYLGQNLQGMAALWAAIFTVLLWLVSVALVNLASAIAIALPPIMEALDYFTQMVDNGKFASLAKGFLAFNVAMFLLAGTVPAMLLVALGFGALSLALLPLGAAIWLTLWPLVKLMELMSSFGDIDFSTTTERFKAFLDGIANMIAASVESFTRLGAILGSSVLVGIVTGTVDALNKINNSGLLDALATSLASTVVNLLDAFVPLLADIFEWAYYKIMSTEWGPMGLLLLTAGIPFLFEKVSLDAIKKGVGTDYAKKADNIKGALGAKAKAAMEDYSADKEASGGGFLSGLFDGANGDTLTDILLDALGSIGLTDFLKNQDTGTGLSNVETDLVEISSLRGGGSSNQNASGSASVTYGGNTYNINVEGKLSEEEINDMVEDIKRALDEQIGDDANAKAQGAGVQPSPVRHGGHAGAY